LDAPYRVRLDAYEGPLDLLLDLIRKQEMDIHDIPIARLTQQYLEYLHQLENMDIDVSADFLYMAATLIYIKSKMLLPADPDMPAGESADPREELVHRLLEHEKFKSAAQMLYEKQQIEEHVWSKPDRTFYDDGEAEGELIVSVVDLVRVFQAVLERRKEVARIELHRETVTVAEMMQQLRARMILTEAPVSLTAFFEDCRSRHAMIVAFLAVLELVRMQAVLLVQEQAFEDILVKKHRMFDAVFAEDGTIRRVDEEYL
jgi:segregation and condensation protein A